MQAQIDSGITLNLAPAAGAGIGRAMFQELVKDPEFPKLLATTARECLLAVNPPRWDKARACWFDDTPDFRTRSQTLFSLLAQAEGMPIQRIIRESIGGSAGGFDLDAELQANPALADGLRRKLENAAFRTRKTKRVQASEPVPPDGNKP